MVSTSDDLMGRKAKNLVSDVWGLKSCLGNIQVEIQKGMKPEVWEGSVGWRSRSRRKKDSGNVN